MQDFWKHKRLDEMNAKEWELLCDGCALCCLHKLQDEQSDEVYYTDVHCRYLNKADCRCSVYRKRQTLVPNCVWLNADTAKEFAWLPTTCAYRLIAENKPLKDWHPLISGSQKTVHSAGISMQNKGINERYIPEYQWEDRIICKAC